MTGSLTFSKPVMNVAALLVFLFGISSCKQTELPKKEEFRSGPIAAEFHPSRQISSSPKLLELGKTVYNKQCAPCHGLDGKGEGVAAYLLYPKPRDLVSAQYRMVSTWERIPTDEDLYYVISRGIPGSAMPSWSHLSEENRWALVHYVKSFAEKPFQVESVASEKRGGVIKLPQESPYTAEAEARAKMLFAEACAPCHGPTGRGDGVQKQFDEKGYPTRPRDLTQGIFKGGSQPEQIYRRIVAGMPGSPMPMSDWAYGEDAWHLTHFVLAMSSEEQRARVEMKKFRIVAHRVDQIPEHPDAGVWREATGVNLHMMPLWWRDDRPEILNAKALHDGKELAIRLMWADETHDHTAIRIQDFRDAAAVEFALTDDPPFFGMGEQGQFVNIWMWKSERQADLEPAFQDIDKVYPNIGIDSYPNLMRSALEQPTRNALTLESDPDFITGWGAGNIVSDPIRKSAAEDLAAQGIGTLKARPMPDQQVQAKGVYDVGTYRVLLRRAFKGSGSNSVNLNPGQTLPVAFAVWNGRAGDRDGKKSVTIWQELVIVD
ncbi:MAG: ethylbenzene dehydrogenase-related protein [bacterium]